MGSIYPMKQGSEETMEEAERTLSGRKPSLRRLIENAFGYRSPFFDEYLSQGANLVCVCF